jgi:hypothetical protein
MRIDISGNMFVGTTSTTGFQTSSSATGTIAYTGGAIASNVSGDAPLYLNRLASDGNIAIFRKDGSTVGSINAGDGDLVIGKTDAGTECYMRFGYSALRIVPSEADGTPNDATLDLGDASARWKDLYLSGGIHLGGTGSANYLDDYEEGTWVPTYVGRTTNFTSITYDGATFGSYRKCGNMVYLSCVLRTDALSGGSGILVVGGIPFSPFSSGDHAISVGYTTAWAGNSPAGGYMAGSTGEIFLTYRTSVSGDLDNLVNVTDMGTGGNDNFLIFTLVYPTST